MSGAAPMVFVVTFGITVPVLTAVAVDWSRKGGAALTKPGFPYTL